jgi:hypothetical protein
MPEDVLHASVPALKRSPVSLAVLLAIVAAVVIWFLADNLPRYLFLDEQSFGRYWPVRGWLLVHIAAGTVALVLGPIQLWLGSTRTYLPWHRTLGVGYVSAVAVGSAAAIGLSIKTQVGWVFGLGLFALAMAWIITTTLAYVSARRRLFAQHREWMIRSYVVTFAFITFRVFTLALRTWEFGTPQERATAASWFCWAVPLLLTEVMLQWNKLAVASRSRTALQH